MNEPQWWVRIDEASHPVPDTATLRAWVRDGRLRRNDLVWRPADKTWVVASEVEELRPQFYPLAIDATGRAKYDLFLLVWPFLSLLLGLFGLLVMLGGLNGGLLPAIGALSWTNTQGRITGSTVAARDERIISGTTVTRFRPQIRYEYSFANRNYESSRIDFSEHPDGDESVNRNDAEQVVARYPAGPVMVYVDPNDPQSSTLDRGDGPIAAFVVGSVMMGVAILILALRRRYRRSAAAHRSTD